MMELGVGCVGVVMVALSVVGRLRSCGVSVLVICKLAGLTVIALGFSSCRSSLTFCFLLQFSPSIELPSPSIEQLVPSLCFISMVLFAG